VNDQKNNSHRRLNARPPTSVLGYGAYGYRRTSSGSTYWFDRAYQSFAVQHPGQPVEPCEVVWPEDLVEECVFKSRYYRTPGSHYRWEA
jgi:hypothetical protein